MRPRALSMTAAACLLFAAGCGEEEVRVYRAPKERAGAGPARRPATMGETVGTPTPPAAAPPASGGGLTWATPRGWTPGPPSQMRLASYRAPALGAAADVSVTSFPGVAGGLDANVNRWRGQIGLEPLSPGEIASKARRVKTAAGVALVVDFTGQGSPGPDGPPRVIGAVLPHGGSSWFFKMSGPQGVVEAAKPAFLGLVRSARPKP